MSSSSLPQPVPRARKPLKEVGGDGGAPVKPVPRVRGSASQKSLQLTESSDDQQQLSQSVETTDGKIEKKDEQVQVSSKGDEPPANEDVSDSDDEPDYMNMPAPQEDSDSDDVDAKTGRRLSNYLNVAPLPEPKPPTSTESLKVSTPSDTKPSQEGEESKTSTGGGDSPDIYKFKPKNRAPARPPPGYKKPPSGTNSVEQSGKDEDASTTPKGNNFARNRPAVKRPSVPPPTSLSNKPQPKVPAKPPRTREKSSATTPPLQPANMSTSPLPGASTPPLQPITPPLLSRPVIISKESLENCKDSVIDIETPSTSVIDEPSSNQKPKEAKHMSPVFPPRKAPNPPPPSNEQVSSKTDPSKKIPAAAVEGNKSSPLGPRKVARAAPPPPKVVKEQNSSPQDEPLSTENTPSTDRKVLKPAPPSGDGSPKLSTPSIGDTSSKQATPTGDKQKTITNERSETEMKPDDQQKEEDSEIVLTRMNLFTVEMRRVEGQGFGLHIAEGYTQTSKGLEVQGVFVRDIVPGSPADNCGRIRESDMIIDIAGSSMVGASLDDAARLLKTSGNIVRLKIGRTFSRTSKGDGCVDPPVNPMQEENDGLKAKVKSLEKELSESVKSVSDLTQALANVTVDKTKLDMKIKSLNDEIDQLKTKSLSTNETEDDKEENIKKAQELQSKVDQLKETNSNLEKELEKTKEENSSIKKDLSLSKAAVTAKDKEIDELKQELEGVKKELLTHKEEHRTSLTEMASLRKEVEKLKSDVSSARNEKETIEKSLSVKILQLEDELKDAQSINKSVKIETEKKEKTPEIEISEAITTEDKTELKEKVRDATPDKEEKDMPPATEESDTPLSKRERDTTPTITEGKDDVIPEEDTVTKETERSSSERSPSHERPLSGVSIPEEDEFSFDELKDVNRLSNTKAVEKSKLSNKIKRNRPSKAHIRSLANLPTFPEESTPLRVPEDDNDSSNKKSISEGQIPMVAPKPKPKPEDKAAVAPKPRPRPQPRKKQSPDHVSEVTTENTKTPPGSPSPSKKLPVPVPRTPSREASTDNKSDDHDGGDSGSSSKRNSDVIHKQPVPIPTEGQDRKSLVKSEDEEPTISKGPPPELPVPKPKPKPSSTSSSEGGGLDSKIEALKRKDPSELTVKEKMILAQQAMAKQAELKSKGIPPPVRKRPPQPMRSDSLDVEGGGATPTPPTAEVSDNMERSQSMDDILDEAGDESGGTPKRQPKKLPPGAFKLGIPMGLPGDVRSRSNTVGSGSGSRTSEVVQEEVTTDDKPSDNSTQVTEQEGPEVQSPSLDPPEQSTISPDPSPEDVPDAPESVISSPDQSCQDTVSNHSNDEDEHLDNTSENLLETEATIGGTPKADADQVLYWTPEVVGIWLTSIGLGSHAPSFVEKGIKGYMIFDLDTSKQKSMGLSSGDDRKVFQKEVKALKPFAEKLRKEHEKQKKEEKKRLEQEKKLAKKKKK